MFAMHSDPEPSQYALRKRNVFIVLLLSQGGSVDGNALRLLPSSVLLLWPPLMAPCASLALHRPIGMAAKPIASLWTHGPAVASIASPNGTVACVVPPGMRKLRTLAGFEIVVQSSNCSISRGIARDGFWEIPDAQHMVAAARRSIPMDGMFLDIGAQQGWYSLLFAKAGFQVIAVEPNTRNREALAATLCFNPDLRKRITVVPVALAAPEDIGRLCVIRPMWTSTNLQLKCGREPEVQRCAAAEQGCEEVPVKTLDALLAEQNPLAISAAKIDVEGYECNIFRGGQTLFQKYHPHFLQVETSSYWKHTCSCVVEEARKHHYQLFPIDKHLGDDRIVHCQTENNCGCHDTLMASSSSFSFSPRFLLFVFLFPFPFASLFLF